MNILISSISDTIYNNETWEYIESKPNYKIIEKINILYDIGEHITIYTARGSITNLDWDTITKNQLKEWGVKYHELRLGKPGGEIYVDDRTISPDELINRWSFYIGIAAQWKKQVKK